MKHARKKKGGVRSNINYGPNFYTSPNLGVGGGGVLCCIVTALRGLGHQCRREMVRSDKFAEPYTEFKPWTSPAR